MIDGEGCINISKRMARNGVHPSYRLELIISNNHRGALERLQSIWGGSLHSIRAGRHTALRLGAKDTEHALACALPYMLIKETQARHALAFYATFHERHQSADVWAEREGYWQGMKALRV
jgi:hypothetical protein